MEKLEGIRLCFCDKKRILEIIVLSVTERENVQGQRWEKALARECISGISESILYESIKGIKTFSKPEKKNKNNLVQ